MFDEKPRAIFYITAFCVPSFTEYVHYFALNL
jgi:hypothetical protein